MYNVKFVQHDCDTVMIFICETKRNKMIDVNAPYTPTFCVGCVPKMAKYANLREPSPLSPHTPTNTPIHKNTLEAHFYLRKSS